MDSFKRCIPAQPIILFHEFQCKLRTIGNVNCILIEKIIHRLGIDLNCYMKIILPVRREEMIVKNICNHRGVMMKLRVKAAFRLQDYRVIVCIAVNEPVQQNSPLDFLRILEIFFSLHRFGNEVTDDEAGVVAGKVEMSEKIHNANIVGSLETGVLAQTLKV